MSGQMLDLRPVPMYGIPFDYDVEIPNPLLEAARDFLPVEEEDEVSFAELGAKLNTVGDMHVSLHRAKAAEAAAVSRRNIRHLR